MEIIIKQIKDPKNREVYERVRELLVYLYPKNEVLSFKKFKKVVKSDVIKVYVALDMKRIVGLATLLCYEKLSGKICIIEDVIVDPKNRRRGIGKKLISKLLIVAQNFGADFVDVYTRRNEAKKFYLKLGFLEKGKERPFYGLRYYL